MPSWQTRAAIERHRLTETTDRDRRAASYTSPTAVLTAVSTSASPASIIIAAHSRIYSNTASVAISGASIDNLAFNTEYTVYYDDPTLASTSPTIVASTNILNGQVGAAQGRHTLGVITTPVSTGASVSGGGSYPPGGTVGGEIP